MPVETFKPSRKISNMSGDSKKLVKHSQPDKLGNSAHQSTQPNVFVYLIFILTVIFFFVYFAHYTTHLFY